jgi:hypothetical protein
VSRSVRTRRSPARGTSTTTQGGLRLLLILAVGVGIALWVVGCDRSPSEAAKFMSSIPGCSGISTQGGDSLDDNTVSEGNCTLSDGSDLDVYIWGDGDTSDLEQYVYINASSGQCCIVGTTPVPWAISLNTIMAVDDDWTSVETALHGQTVTNPPASWSAGVGPVPIPPGPKPPPSRSPSPSPTSSSPSPPPSASPSPSPSPSAAPPQVAPPQPPASSSAAGAWCTATASVYNAEYNWNNVYVHSNQPYTDATASADGHSWSYETNGSGYALIYLNGPPPGAEITVAVGGATCTTSD